MTEIEKLVAIEAIKRVKARYNRFMDTKKWTEYETVFCSDVTADYRDSTRDPLGPSAGSYRGIHGFGHHHETYKCVGGNWLIQTVYVTRLLIDFL